VSEEVVRVKVRVKEGIRCLGEGVSQAAQRFLSGQRREFDVNQMSGEESMGLSKIALFVCKCAKATCMLV